MFAAWTCGSGRAEGTPARQSPFGLVFTKSSLIYLKIIIFIFLSLTHFCVGIAASSALAQGEAGGTDQGHDQLQRVLVVAELQLQPPLDRNRLRGGAGATAHADDTHPVAMEVSAGRSLLVL